MVRPAGVSGRSAPLRHRISGPQTLRHGPAGAGARAAAAKGRPGTAPGVAATGVAATGAAAAGRATAGAAAAGGLTHVRRSIYQRIGKPLFDRSLGLVALLLLAPVMVLVAIAVAVSLGRPLLIRQERVGRGGEVFQMLKFRTMHPDRRRNRATRWPHEERRRTHKSPDDPRHTPVGRCLRRFSLDELPQLWNVVRGDMSLVGPRPELVEVVDRYEPWQHARHAVKPGLTGLWQVTDRANGELMLRHTSTDLRYLEDISLATDLKILALTIPAAMGKTPGQ